MAKAETELLQKILNELKEIKEVLKNKEIAEDNDDEGEDVEIENETEKDQGETDNN